ncbi:uncharacterized protein V1510DRAFT_306940 [Dipodascopsis tothii]|uniref:uncharacterized protein n=1 Tax=Dipodascopsis tothii TaxID=44089 RepID=UPI0034CF7EE7
MIESKSAQSKRSAESTPVAKTASSASIAVSESASSHTSASGAGTPAATESATKVQAGNGGAALPAVSEHTHSRMKLPGTSAIKRTPTVHGPRPQSSEGMFSSSRQRLSATIRHGKTPSSANLQTAYAVPEEKVEAAANSAQLGGLKDLTAALESKGGLPGATKEQPVTEQKTATPVPPVATTPALAAPKETTADVLGDWTPSMRPPGDQPAPNEISHPFYRQWYEHLNYCYSTTLAKSQADEDTIRGLQENLASLSLDRNKTIRDDTEYSALWLQLDGAVRTAGFKLRELWNLDKLPEWLNGRSRKNLVVGRAIISRFLYERVFYGDVVNPYLPLDQSRHLATVQRAIAKRRPEELAYWRAQTLDLMLSTDPQVRSKNMSTHLEKLKKDFAKLIAPFWNATPAGGLPEIPTEISDIFELSLQIIALMSAETRDFYVRFYNEGDAFDPSQMTDADESKEESVNRKEGVVSVSVFLSLEKVQGDRRHVIFKAPVWCA